MKTYVKKPVKIQAVEFDGSTTSKEAINVWINGGEYKKPAITTRDIVTLTINTLEGEMTASKGDYIIKGIGGEFYPCKPSIFQQTYDLTDE